MLLGEPGACYDEAEAVLRKNRDALKGQVAELDQVLDSSHDINLLTQAWVKKLRVQPQLYLLGIQIQQANEAAERRRQATLTTDEEVKACLLTMAEAQDQLTHSGVDVHAENALQTALSRNIGNSWLARRRAAAQLLLAEARVQAEWEQRQHERFWSEGGVMMSVLSFAGVVLSLYMLVQSMRGTCSIALALLSLVSCVLNLLICARMAGPEAVDARCITACCLCEVLLMIAITATGLGVYAHNHRCGSYVLIPMLVSWILHVMAWLTQFFCLAWSSYRARHRHQVLYL
jgi:hypothetical protein